MRTHVDVDDEVGLSGLEPVMRLKERYRAPIDAQVLAFPQTGILRDHGTADLLDAAVAAGADLVGIDGDVRGRLHDPDLLGAFELRDVAAAAPSAMPTRSERRDMTNAAGNGLMPPVLRLREGGVTVFAGPTTSEMPGLSVPWQTDSSAWPAPC